MSRASQPFPPAWEAPVWAQRWLDAQRRTDELFELLAPGAIYDRPVPERHRLIFYLGHLEAFDWNLLSGRALGAKPFNPGWDKLFAFGIDPVDSSGPADTPADWPAESEVRAYGQRIRAELRPVFERPLKEWETWMHVAIEHRLMHAETLAYLLHALPYERKRGKREMPGPGRTLVNALVAIPAGPACLGARREDGFGWDNEFEANQVAVAAFSAQRYKVTNGEYLAFVEDGGYGDARWWTAENWAWRAAQGLQQPHFWTGGDGQRAWRSMFGPIPLPLDWPVWVSQAEAAAYVKWAGLELPTEAQWQRMAYGGPNGPQREFPWGQAAPNRQGNFDFQHWEPEAVTAHPEGASAWGVHDLLGNGWEWTSSVFGPFAGFQPFDFYRGYSADFFDGKHFVLKGASPRTAACMLRRSFRNWFQPHYPYLFAGFRGVQAA